MANRTVKDALTVKGTNPQYLVEKIIRSRIYDSKYWKENCFALTAELLVDKAMELRYEWYFIFQTSRWECVHRPVDRLFPFAKVSKERWFCPAKLIMIFLSHNDNFYISANISIIFSIFLVSETFFLSFKRYIINNVDGLSNF